MKRLLAVKFTKMKRPFTRLSKLNIVFISLFSLSVCLNITFLNKIGHLKVEIFRLTAEMKQRPCPKDPPKSTNSADFRLSLGIPLEAKLDRNPANENALKAFTDNVMVLIYINDNVHCLENQIATVQKIYPGIKIIVSTNLNIPIHSDSVRVIDEVTTEGQGLNKMIALVTTKYFMYLAENAIPSDFNSDNSQQWLYQALESIPELDVIGGSYLRYNSSTRYPLLEIQCYRHKTCYWVFEQRYEYQYSVGDMMLCEETSSSFMARTASIAKLPRFDENLPAMVTTDFFYQCKHKAVVGLRPEVFFDIPAKCTPASLTLTQRLPFMRKYDVTRIRDSYDEEYIDPDYKTQSKFIWHIHGGLHSVSMLEYLRRMMILVDDFFISKNVTYYVEHGVSLGGLKMRDVLPWDTGDIDTNFWGNSEDVKSGLQDHCREKGVDCYFRFIPMGNGEQELMLGLNAEFIDGGNTMFPQTGTYDDRSFMYIAIHGRHIPIKRKLFQNLREIYGYNYLRHTDHGGNVLECKNKGHHACVPEQFRYGAGHWSDYYCQL